MKRQTTNIAERWVVVFIDCPVVEVLSAAIWNRETPGSNPARNNFFLSVSIVLGFII